jgi:carboxymethylenebutenolidase
MADDLLDPAVIKHDGLSRRGFATLSVATGLAAAGSAARAAAAVTETDVQIKTADGMCDAVFFHPQAKGSFPAVLIWTDILGLRPAFRDMGRRLAAEGNYAVLVPNPFYRVRKAPVLEGKFDFANPADRAKLGELTKPNTPDAVTRDAGSFIAWLDSQPQVNKKAKVGTQGYCMGGALTMRTAALRPDRVAAAGSFHGGNGLVTDAPDSPHLLIPKMKASFLFAVAQNDDQQKPDLKDKLKAAYDAAKVPAVVEVYKAQHGWCVPDSAVYNKDEAERGWANLLALYRKSLA